MTLRFYSSQELHQRSPVGCDLPPLALGRGGQQADLRPGTKAGDEISGKDKVCYTLLSIRDGVEEISDDTGKRNRSREE
jgi:hypothetical protein